MLRLLKWLLIVVGLVSALIFAGVLTAPVAAQTATESGESLNPGLVLVDSGYDDGQGWVELHAETRQEVTVYDASGVFAGGDVAHKEVVLPPNSTRTVSVQSTESRDARVLGIQHEAGHHAEVLSDGRTWIDDWGRTDVALAIVMTAAISIVLVVGLERLFRRVLGDQSGRIA